MVPCRTLVVRPLIALFVAVLLATGAAAQEVKFRPIDGGGVEREYIVVLQDVPPAHVAGISAELSQQYGAAVRQTWTQAITGFWAVMPESAARAMSSDPRVQFIQQNAVMLPSGSQDVGPDAVPLNRNDKANSDDPGAPFPYSRFPSPLYPNPLWHLRRLSHRLHDSGAQYTYVSAGRDVNIYVVDYGVLRFHQEFIRPDSSSAASVQDRENPLLHDRVAEVPGSKIVPAPDARFGDGDGYPSSAPWRNTHNPPCPATEDCQATCVPPENAPELERTDGTFARYNPTIWFADRSISHGMACGSVAAGRNVGVAKEATIIPVKVLGCDDERTGTEAELISAFEWVLTEVQAKSPRVASVVTMSTYRAIGACSPYEPNRCRSGTLIGLPHTTALEETIRKVIDEGVPVVASANNLARDACNDTPARLSRSGGIANLGDGRGGVITVGGWAKDADERWTEPATAPEPGSNWGPCIDLWAPAERIAVADANSWYAYRDGTFSGTSFSAPMVAGIVARLLSEDATFSSDLNDATKRPGVVQRIWDRLKDSATPFEKEALRSEIEFPPPTPPAVQSPDDALGAAILEASPRRLAYIGAFSFKTQPQPVRLTDDEQFLTAEPLAGATSYQWYREQDAVTSVAIPGATSSTLCVRRDHPPCMNPSTNTRYWVHAAKPDPQKPDSSVYADSASATVVVDKPIFLKYPANTWVRRGGVVTLNTEVLVPEASNATYEWFMKPDPTHTVRGRASSYSFSASETVTYYVTVTANGQSITSDSAVVRVIGAESEKPQSVTIAYDPPIARDYQLAHFNVKVSAQGTGLQRQWYIGARGDVTKPIFSAPEDFESGSRLSLVPGQYTSLWARVSNEAGFADSENVTPLPVCNRFTIELSTISNRVVTTGGMSVMTARVVPTTYPTSGSYTYEWYRDDGQQLIKDSSLSGAVVRASNPTIETVYRAVIRNSLCATPVASEIIRLHPGGCPSSVPSNVPETKLLYRGTAPHNALHIPFNAPVRWYEWWAGNGDIGTPFQSKSCPPEGCNEATLLADPSAPPLPTQVWLRVKTCEALDRNDVWEDTNLINIGVISCGQNNFSLATAPRNVGVSTTFDLLAPEAPAGSIYKWYRGMVPADVLLGQTTAPSFTVTGGVSEGTFYSVVIEGATSCNPTPVRSNYHYVNPCGSPRRRAVRSSSGVTAIRSGNAVTLSVDDDQDGVTFQWYRGTTYSDISNPAGEGATIFQSPTETTTYWVRMLRACTSRTFSTDSDFITVTVDNAPAILIPPTAVTQAMANPGQTVAVTTSVVASGAGTLSYAWYVNGSSVPDATQTGSSYTWFYQVPNPQPVSAQRTVRVVVTSPYGSVASDTVTLNIVREVSQSVFAYQKMSSLYAPGHAATLFVDMDPQAGPQHAYQYEWFEDDGTPTGHKLNTTGPQVVVQTSSISIFWARITGTHQTDLGTYSEVTISPRMYVYRYGSCELPPLHVSQSLTNIPLGTTPPVTFIAVCDWPGVEFQWFEGQSGDTRTPITADAGKPNQLTASSDTIHAYWVRASRDCGVVSDSPTLIFTRGQCGPVLINQNIASVEVPYGEGTSLHVDPAGISNPSYTWYREGDATAVGHERILSFDRVTKSGRYWVKVRNLDCGNRSDSYVATVRVFSAPSITVPQWQTERWTDYDTTTTLSAPAAGATWYEWFEGVVGDEGHRISNELSSAYVTPKLKSDTKYWVRIHGAGTDIIDSPTLTVRVCDAPHVSGTLFLNENIVPGQWASFLIPVTGTQPLQYRWYQGPRGNTSQPVGQPVDKLMVHPNETTQYWVRVTGTCGASGNDLRTYDSPNFTASVCPALSTPTAAKTIVMPNTTTTLSIDAGGSGLTYRWYVGIAGDKTHPIASSNMPTITTPSITQTTTFWCEVTSGQCPRNSEGITISPCDLPTVYINGRDKVNKNYYQVLSLSGVPTDQNREIMWYQGERGDISTPITSQGGLGVSPSQTTKYWARVTFTDTGCYADSNAFEVSVCIPMITAQPQPTMINAGASATMSVGVDLPGMSYQWYAGPSGNTSNPVVGQTTATLTVTPAVNTSYWVRVSGCTPYAVNSAAAMVTICEPPSIYRQPSGASITANFSWGFSVGASGSGLTYQWYKGVSGNISTPLAGKTAAELTVSINETTDYWVKVSGACGTPLNSNTAKISIPPTITTEPTGGGVVMPSSVRTMTVVAAGTQLSYEWHKLVGGNDTVIAGATSASYTTPGITADVTYYCRVYSGLNFRDSGQVAFVVCQLPAIGFSSYNAQVVSGHYQVLSVNGVPTNTPYGYAWYRGNSGDITNPISGQAAIGVSPSVSTSYWVRVTATETGCWVDSTTLTINVCRPTITTQPAASTTIDKVSNPSAYAALTVAANITPVTYQWYIGSPGNTANPIAGATSSTYSASPGSTTTYWVRVTGNCGYSQDSTAATVVVCQSPQITQHPLSSTSVPNSTRTLGVTATGTQLAYAWFVGTTGTTTTPIGGNNPTVNVTPSVTTDYWARVTGFCGTANSNAAKISIAPAFTTQPVGGPITKGTTRMLTVAVSGTQLSYQWYSRGGGVDTIIAGATAAAYTTPPISADSTYFARVSSGAAFADSSEATLTVCQPRGINMSATTTVSGANGTLTVSDPSPNGDETYEWYRGASGSTSTLISTSNAIGVAPLETTLYWLRTKRASCNADSPAVTVQVCIPKINTQPAGGMIASGTTKTLSVVATGTPTMTYQWYIGAAGLTTNPIAGATGASYTTPNLTASTTYWVRIACPLQGCGQNSVDITAATVTVCQPPVITQQPTPRSVNWNQSTTLQVTATGDGLSYQWYQGTAGVTTTPVGSNSRSLTMTPGTNKSYWVRVSGTCGTVDSSVVLVSVFPYIQEQPTDTTLCGLGSSATFSVVATGTNLTYQWFRQYSSSASVMVGATPTVSVQITQVPVYVWCQITSGNATTWTNQVGITQVVSSPTVYNISKTAWSGGRYLLQSNVSQSDRPLVLWKWYEGPVSNTAASTLLYDSGYNEYIVVQPVSLPKTYWVRVFYQDTGCPTDVAVTVP